MDSDTRSLNVVGRVSHYFLGNRPLSLLLLAAILLFGLLSFWLTPKQYNPEIVRPAFMVSLTYDGVTVDEAVERVVYELVEKVRTVPGIDDVYTEVRDGAEIHTTVLFDVGYDPTRAKLDLLSQLEQHKHVRSGFVSEPIVREIDPETVPVLQVVFGSSNLAVSELRSQVVRLSQTLGQVEGVSGVEVHGGYSTALVVEVDPQKLAGEGVALAELIDTLKSSQLRSRVGSIESDPYRVEVVFDSRVHTPEQVGLLTIRDSVRVRDVASVYEGFAGTRGHVFHATADTFGEVVVLAVSKVEGSSAPQVTKALRAALDARIADSDSAFTYEVVGDDGATASQEVRGLTVNLITSIAIVAGVLMLFLSLRAALVVLVAIPVTLLIVFGLGLLFGETINRITLFALILSLGLLVDSAIVVVENVYGHLKTWRATRDTRTRVQVLAGAVHEVGVGLILSTVTSVIVFLPMGYITGMMGPYMGPIAFFVPAALLVSLFVAIVVTPFVASVFLADTEQETKFARWCTGIQEKGVSWYTGFLRQVLSERRAQKRLLLGALGGFMLVLLLPLFGLVHFQMLPKADRDQLYVYVDLPVDTSSKSTEIFSRALTEVLLRDSDVQSVQLYVGEPPVLDFNGMFKGAQYRSAPYEATLRVNLTPATSRTRSSSDITTDVRELVAVALEETAAYVRFMEEPPGPPVRATFEAKVSGESLDEQQRAVETLAAVLSEIDGVVDVYTTQDAPVGRTVFRVDHEAAAELGVQVSSIESTLRLLGGSYVVSEYLNTDGVEFSPVLLTLPASSRTGPMDSGALSVGVESGAVVPLGAVVVQETELRPSRTLYEGVVPVTYVTAEVEGRSIVYVMVDVFKLLIRGQVPGFEVLDWGLFGVTLHDQATGSTVTTTWGGEWEMTLENFRDLGIAMGVALLLVYAVLVAQYKSFATPAFILVTVPLSLVGIFSGFLILDAGFGVYLTATALIGFIALIGIVVNNAILYLESVEQMLRSGTTYTDALVEAGATRLRPILLTSLTTVLGSLTIAGDPVWSGLAWAIVCGLSLSTALTLIVYPTLLMYFRSATTNN